ncbi:MerR family transcriptional regulator [Peribacillus castrilensis]|uniref:Multidrug-efflux transporter genes transcriptional regulator n=1 Tax=Peribacillus simplex TaxID=1478 RepID=A0AAN2PHD4_9BACI|nr:MULTISPECIES: helix-turn-helix domain-containing protein [Bacillaceae]MBD8591651.1 MerR family transcriptional regulator [Peribacillus simplex]MEA3576201.1 helix-turn-helix domain-containing protein [Peribacillus frigoritolerans]NCT38407.1 MerR family transcriptional regulator [Peribacillus frigoritolerans]CEG32434.1 multidrug-efflux transporter genes transcriptional regulator [Peribacillus simplex]
MQNKLSIGEMAKLRGVTVDTLRHYDKIGLLKPYHIDPETGYRYYSISQYEVLGTIKELRSIGFSLEEIKQFLTNRNVKKSVQSLQKSMANIQEEIKKLQHIHNILMTRLYNIEHFTNSYSNSDIVIKQFEEREYIQLARSVSWADTENLYFGYLELENKIGGIIPALASNKFGDFIKKEYFDEIRQSSDFSANLSDYQSQSFILVQDEESEQPTQKIENGLFLCSYYGGLTREKMLTQLKKLLHHCDTHDYIITGDAFRIMQVDVSLTDQYDEAYYEIQIPIKEKVTSEQPSK